MAQVIAASDFVSALFLLIVICGTLMEKGTKSVTEKYFLSSVAATVVCTVVDGISYLLEGPAYPTGVLTVVNLIAIGGCDLAAVPFIYYVNSLMTEKKKTATLVANLVSLACVADLLFVLISYFTGDLFSIENGVFVEQPLFRFCGVIEIAALVAFLVSLFVMRRSVGTKAVIVTSLYLLLPIIAAVYSWIGNSVSVAYVAISASLMLVSVSFQTGEIERGRMREKIMYEVLKTDTLTGLGNRRACEVTISDLRNEKTVGAVFCDLNGLKHVNDTKGHHTGDELIIRFSELLKSCFPVEEVFRISGDEFVVLEKCDGEAAFREKAEKFRQVIAENDWLAAFGYVVGAGKDAVALIRDAEKEMYADKNTYYRERETAREI